MCKICEIYRNNDIIIMENETCFAMRHINPVGYGHIIIATKEHKESYFDLTYKENEDMFMLSRNIKSNLDKQIKPEGYNLGYNVGVWAGQEFPHVHMHIIPRFAGDCPATELKGGISRVKGR